MIGDVLYPQDARNGSSPPILDPAFVALWTGYLIKDGRYVTITTPAGEHARVTIARSLHPGRK